MSLPQVLDALATVIRDVTGVQTVHVGPPSVPTTGNTRLPVVIVESQRSNVMPAARFVWEHEIDVTYLHAERGPQVTTDLTDELYAVLGIPEQLVTAFNAHQTLGGLVFGFNYGSPAVEGPTVIQWRDRQYVGFRMSLLLKQKFHVSFTG